MEENREKAEGALDVRLSFTVTTNVIKQALPELKEKVMTYMEIAGEIQKSYPGANIYVEFENLSSQKYK